jgi:signal transduction histidine kinase/HAMP domain-containing protein
MLEQIRSPLLRKYVRVLSVLVGGTLMLSGLAELYFSYGQAQRAIVEVEQVHATAAALRIEQFLNEVQEQVRDTTRSASDDPSAGPLGAAALGFREGLAASIAEQRELDFLRVLRRVPAISDLRHLDVSGREVIRVSRLHPDVVDSGVDFSAAPEFVAARKGAIYWSAVRLRDDAEPYVVLAMPVGTYAVEVTAAEVGLRTLQRIVSRLAVGAGGYTYVVDARDRLIAHPDARTLRERRDLSRLAQVESARAHVAGGPQASASAMFADGVGGGRVLAAHAVIAPLGWLVFVERPAADAYAALREPIMRSFAIFVLGLALAVLASGFLARRMVAPIRTLQAGAARIGAGDLDHRVDIATGDELEALGNELNHSAAELAGARATLEHKVEARTRELARSLEELHVLSEVARAVSSSLDLDTVLDTIVARAAHLAGADGGVLYEYDEASACFSWIRGTFCVEDDLLQVLRAHPIRLGEGAAGRAAVLRAPVQVSDVLAEGSYDVRRVRAIFERHGYRSLLAVPLLYEERIVGVLAIWRREPGLLARPVVNLVQTLATQSVLAIQNARLFHEIADKSRQLEAASRHKSEFLANMSHELRTPLNAVIGFSEVLAEGMFGELNAKQAEYVRDIMESGRHLLSLINDILDLSKVEAGRMELELAEFDLASVVDGALLLMRERANRKGIELAREDVDASIPNVRADERKVKQVLLNLLSNALKFTPDGGRVAVRIAARDGMVAVAVSDTGVGIAKQDQQAVFEEFRQVGSAAKRVEGTGLGLALVRKFVELHGGCIGVESEPGAGSTFTFTIPAAPST